MGLDDVRVLTRHDSATNTQAMTALLDDIGGLILLLPDAQQALVREKLASLWDLTVAQHKLHDENERAMRDAAKMLDAARNSNTRLVRQRNRLLAQVEDEEEKVQRLQDDALAYADEAIGEQIENHLGLPAGWGGDIINLLAGTDDTDLTDQQRQAFHVWLRLLRRSTEHAHAGE